VRFWAGWLVRLPSWPRVLSRPKSGNYGISTTISSPRDRLSSVTPKTVGWKSSPLPRCNVHTPWPAHGNGPTQRDVLGHADGDDYVIEPVFNVPAIYSGLDWGLKETRVGGEMGGTSAIRWESPVKGMEDLQKLRFPAIKVDHELTQSLFDLAESVVGESLQVRLKTFWWWTLGMTLDLALLRGLGQIMYDFTENPELIHKLMGFLRDGTLHLLDQLEEQNLLALNNDGYVGSGGLGYTRELPQPDFKGKVRPSICGDLLKARRQPAFLPRCSASSFCPISCRFGAIRLELLWLLRAAG